MSKSYVNCSQCGEKNSLTRLFCKSCGTKLDMSTARLRMARKPWVRHVQHSVGLVVLLAFLGLMLWSPRPIGEMGSDQDGLDAYRKIIELYGAVEEGRSLHRDFSEREMNAYLGVRVDDSTEVEQRGFGLGLENINLSFTEDQFTAHIATRWQIVPLSYVIVGEPFVEGRGVQVRLHRVSLGRLPMPAPLRDTFAARMMPVLEALEHEWTILRNVSRIGIRNGECRIMVSP